MGYQACFYSGYSYTGSYFCLNLGESVDNLARYNMDNRISSMIIPAGYSVQVFSGYGYQGSSQIFWGDIPDLGAYGQGWEDHISSLIYR